MNVRGGEQDRTWSTGRQQGSFAQSNRDGNLGRVNKAGKRCEQRMVGRWNKEWAPSPCANGVPIWSSVSASVAPVACTLMGSSCLEISSIPDPRRVPPGGSPRSTNNGSVKRLSRATVEPSDAACSSSKPLPLSVLACEDCPRKRHIPSGCLDVPHVAQVCHGGNKDDIHPSTVTHYLFPCLGSFRGGQIPDLERAVPRVSLSPANLIPSV